MSCPFNKQEFAILNASLGSDLGKNKFMKKAF